MPRPLTVGAIIAGLGSVALAQGGRPALPEGIEVLQLRPGFYMVAGGGANVAVQAGDDGVVVVDSGSAGSAAAVLAAIASITSAPIRYLINTSAGAEHVGGNETISRAGVSILGTRVTGLPGSANFHGPGPAPASILAMEQVLRRMSAPTGEVAPYPVGSWPTETIPFGRKNMYLNGEGIEMIHQPEAHSDGDAIVFFRRSDVIAVGELIDATRFPVIDLARGGSIQGVLEALNRLIDMAIPSVPIITRDEGTLVVPARGRLYDQFDVVAYRDMLSIVRDRVRDLRTAGRTLEQVVAADPTSGYRGRYGAESGSWTTRAFVEAIYRSLPPVKP